MELRIDGYIGQDSGLASLLGDGSSFSLSKLESLLDGNTDTSLKIKINSGGGSVVEGFALHDRLASSGLKIETEVLGMCGSIATIIALAAPKGSRYGHENSEYFIHNPYWTPAAPEPMEATDLQRLTAELKDAEERILDFYVDKTGAKRSELKKLMQEKTSLSMKEAKRLGFIDEIITEAVTAEKHYKVLAYVETKNNNDMSKFSDDQKSWLEKQFSAIGEKIKNMVDAEVVAPPVEAPSEVDTLKAQIAELTAKLEKATADLQAATDQIAKFEAEKTTVETAKADLTKELETIKNMVLGNAPLPAGQQFTPPPAPKSITEQIKEIQDKKNKK